MPLASVAAMRKSLDNDYGSDHGPNSPTSFELALFTGDPTIDPGDGGGVELNSTDCPGYARVAIAHADFEPATVDAVKDLTDLAQFPNATGPWDLTARYFVYFDATTDDMWEFGELDEEIEITVAGVGPAIATPIYYAEAVEETDL